MYRELLIKLVAALVNRLDRGQMGRGDRPPEDKILFGLTEEVRGILTPVKPSVSFRKDLQGRLEMIAQKRVILEPRRPRSWFILLAAAGLGSALSVLGFLVYFLTSRLSRRSHPAS